MKLAIGNQAKSKGAVLRTKVFLGLVGLSIWGYGCNGGTTSSSSHDPNYTQALAKAEEWQKSKIFVMAEAEARKAVKLEPKSPEANFALFLALAGQNTNAAKRNEALDLARPLLGDFPAQSPQRASLSAFIDQQESKDALAELERAVGSQSPKAFQLLEKVPAKSRNSRYWFLAFKVHQEAGQSKLALEAAQQLRRIDPEMAKSGVVASFLKEADLGLNQSPGLAFAAMRNCSSSVWHRFVLEVGPSSRRSILWGILKDCRIVSVKEGPSKLVLALAPKNGTKPKPRNVTIAYQLQGGRWLISLEKSNFSEALPLLRDPVHTLKEDFCGVAGIFDVRSPSLDQLTRIYGPPRLFQWDGRQLEELTQEQRGYYLSVFAFFGDDFGLQLQKCQGRSYSLQAFLICSPKFRTSAGLGVGSSRNQAAAYVISDRYTDRYTYARYPTPLGVKQNLLWSDLPQLESRDSVGTRRFLFSSNLDQDLEVVLLYIDRYRRHLFSF